MSRPAWLEASHEPTSPLSPTSPTSPLNVFLDQSEDALEWVTEWERRSTTMDEKHVEVLISQWKLMRESAKEHAKLFHQMKLAMRDLRGYSVTLQDRLDAVESRLRDDMGREQAGRIDSLEKRLREKINQEQANREADIAELQDQLKNFKGDEFLDLVKEQLAKEKQAREVGLDTIQRLLAKEADVLREVKRHLGDETEARESANRSLQDRVDRFERLLAESADRQAALQAALRESAVDKEKRDHENWVLQGRLGQLQEKLEEGLRKEQALREAGLDKLRELLEGQLSRDRGLDNFKDLLASEKAAREAHAGALQDLLRTEADKREVGLGEVRSELLRERSARERLGDSLKGTMDEKLGQLSTSLQGRIDHVLRILQGSTGDMLSFWRGAERGSRSA